MKSSYYGTPAGSTLKHCRIHSVKKIAFSSLITLTVLLTSMASYAGQGSWRFTGGNIHNTAYNKSENEISPANVGQLVPKFIYKTAPDGEIGDVKTPAILGHKVYFADFAGNLTALDNRNGTVIWKKNFLTDYTPLLHGKDNNIPVGATVTQGWSSPAIVGNLLIIGNGMPLLDYVPSESGAILMAVNRHTGALVWAKQIDSHPTAIVTQSAVAKGNKIYVGVSSGESGTVILGIGTERNGPVVLPSGKLYSCCSFRGSMVALNATTGKILWKFHTVPNAPGEPAGALDDWTLRHTGPAHSWSGNSVWGNTPVIDLSRGLLYFGTGQTHTIPHDVAAQNNLAFPAPYTQLTSGAYPSSIPAGNYPASIIALNLQDGTVNWSKSFGKLRGFDGWNGACFSFFSIPNFPSDFADIVYCPANVEYSSTNQFDNFFLINHPFDFYLSSQFQGGSSPFSPNGDFANLPVPFPSGSTTWDQDFGQGPMLVRNVLMPNGKKRDLLIAAQKSGVTRALDPSTGAVLWQTYEGSGGHGEGGHEFGSATDGKRVYLATNFDDLYTTVQLLGLTPLGVTLKDGTNTQGQGYFSALDIATGQILWETVAPFGAGAADAFTGLPGIPSVTGSMSVANGVVYGVVSDDNGTLVAMDAATGQILLEYPTANVAAGDPGGMRTQRAVVVNGVLYLGTGGSQLTGLPDNKFIALQLPTHKTYADDNTDTNDNDNNIDGDDTGAQ